MRSSVLYLVLVSAASAQLGPDAALKSFELADTGLRVELVASEPIVESPCAMAFDEHGRIFVAENRGYPNDTQPPVGRVALLEDTDGDGYMDKRSTFAEGLTFPNGVLPWRGGVIVTCAPDILFLKDTDGDGRADERRVLLTGFDTKGSTQLRVNCPTVGPDGWIYLAAGLSGGSLTSPEHLERPPLKMTADVRFHPDNLEMENVDGRSQYGMSFDDAGRRFICMNRIQVQHVVIDSKWLRRNPLLAFSDTVQNCPELVPNGLMHSAAGAARLYPISANITTADSHQGFFSAACAVTIWPGGTLPASYRGQAFSCDPTGNLVHADRLVPQGSTFAAVSMFEKREFLASRDDWFRPVFLSGGPDGSLYIVDMYRKVIEHPDYLPEEVRKRTDFESGKSMGRIWRVRANVPTLNFSAKSVAVDRLKTIAELGNTQGDESLGALVRVMQEQPKDRWVRAVVLSGLAGREEDFLHELLKSRGTLAPELTEAMVTLGRGLKNETRLLAFLGSESAQATEPEFLFSLFEGFIHVHGTKQILAEEDSPARALIQQAMSIASDNAKTPESRLAAIRLLGRIPNYSAVPRILLEAVQKSDDAAVQTAAIRAVAGFNVAEVSRELLSKVRWRGYSPSQRDTILTALLGNPYHLGGILDAIESNAVPANTITSQRRAPFARSKEAAIRERSDKLLKSTTPDREAALARAKTALTLNPTPPRGRELFKTLCASCHRFEREGIAVGPDLFDIRNQSKENILFHIVVPDAEIAPAFAAYLIEARNGRTLAGLLASETPSSVTVRMPLGQEETILRRDVAKIESLPNSLMPTGLDAAMTPQDLADLLAYLRGEK
ncbi:MAG TPA: PVC-type heme-binding CxxCH protein [Chthoniobacteraceae bacterium]|nr:PVC-type heme-binding CxxCH protein [Chthoniobacteraceae bacterium]